MCWLHPTLGLCADSFIGWQGILSWGRGGPLPLASVYFCNNSLPPPMFIFFRNQFPVLCPTPAATPCMTSNVTTGTAFSLQLFTEFTPCGSFYPPRIKQTKVLIRLDSLRLCRQCFPLFNALNRPTLLQGGDIFVQPGEIVVPVSLAGW